jgi:hypothetical protein
MFGKKKSKSNKEGRIILGMIMIEDENSFNFNSFLADFKDNYDEKIRKPTFTDSSAAFNIDGELVAIGHIPIPIPEGDIKTTAEYAYTWPTAAEELKSHKSHLIVTVAHGGQDQVKRFRIFTQVLCALLRTTNAIGIYKGNQSLLIPKEDYLDEAALMSDDYLPLNLWIYFGLKVSGSNTSGYTYGLKEFNKPEMEIVNSAKNLEDIRGFLFNMAHYVLEYDVTFEDGQTCGLSADEIIPISFSKGIQTEGDTFKLAY